MLGLTGTAICMAAATATAFLRGGFSDGRPPREVFWDTMPKSLDAIPNVGLLVAPAAANHGAVYAAVARNLRTMFLAVILAHSAGGAIVANLLIMT